MSFSTDIKEELSRIDSGARHCKLAETAAMIQYCGQVKIDSNVKYSLGIHTENPAVAKHFFSLIKETFGVSAKLSVQRNDYLKRNRNYSVFVDNHDETVLILKAVKLLDNNNFGIILQNTCCKRAYLRGAFLGAGSMSDPEKHYHFEITTMSQVLAQKLRDIMNSFDLEAKIVLRKKYHVIYIKEGAKIVDVLNIMEAHIALMNLENIRIMKDMRNSVNRRVNCETANINKTVSAAVKQLEDIEFIIERGKFSELNQGLRDVANLRLDNPEASLKELGEMLSPPVGKSGVNHRMKKLSRIADDMKVGGRL
ncbi:MAG: DNA-binding protein WhiA [Anaerostipes sp.]|jgi:DNA-binding protein WhiA|nr:DNA-binding protein WhiA [Anaerostipes sp.]MDD3747572.1 DNA-binding protein WhiA [Anaerostipes sp.]